MSPHYDRHADASAEQNDFNEWPDNRLDNDAMDNAADALRQADIESAQEEFNASSLDWDKLTLMRIDELRVIAKQLDVPDRNTITDQDELIAAIRRQL